MQPAVLRPGRGSLLPPPFSNQAVNLPSSKLEMSSASTLGTSEGHLGAPLGHPSRYASPLHRAGSARGSARGVCSMRVTCTHSAACVQCLGTWMMTPTSGIGTLGWASHLLSFTPTS